jgi:hypothetical protein
MARRELLVRSCPNCGARIEAEPEEGRVLCRYCGQSFDLAPEIPAPPPQRIVVIAPARIRPVPPPARRFAGGLVVLAVGAALIAVRAGLVSTRSVPQSLLRTLPALPSAIVRSDFIWDTVGGSPIPAAVAAAGSEGFIGRIRMRGDDTLWIAAFDGAKPAMVWKTGPFGTYSEGYTSTFASVIGRGVVVTDYRATVHVYDLASGRETRTLRLSDRAKSMCAAPDGKPHAWIETKDEKSILFNADLGTVAAAPRPPWCVDASSGGDCRGWHGRGPPRLGCRDPSFAPKVSGFEASNVLEEGDVAVALGKKHPGTGVPIAIGFDPKTKALRWQQPVYSGDQASVAESSAISVMDALAGGRFVTPYQVTSKAWHFTAFEGKTGQRLWDVPLQPIFGIDYPEGLSLSMSRLYVMRTYSVEIYDAKTGELLGSVGGP